MNIINFESFQVIFDLVCVLKLWMNCKRIYKGFWTEL
jgi:hypothetical protein